MPWPPVHRARNLHVVPERRPEGGRGVVERARAVAGPAAVGAPGEAVGAEAGAGALNVLYGSADGLQPSPDIFFQGSGGLGGTAEAFDFFGAALE